MILRKDREALTTINDDDLMITSISRVNMWWHSIQPKIHEETLPENQVHSLPQEEIRSSGILEVIDEVGKQLHQEYIDVPPTTDTYRPFLESELYEKAVSRILEQARSLDGVKGESNMNYEAVMGSLRPYATGIQTEEYSYGAYGTVCYIFLRKLTVLVLADDIRVQTINDQGRTIYSYEDTSYLKAILLLDAARDELMVMLQKLLLEIKSMLSAQEIYMNYARIVADTMTSQYQGKTRVSHKGNRTTLHFYLSDTEKAVITFFQTQMPWTMPEPPTDPDSLRKTCQEEGSPFFIVSLGKRDRNRLKSIGNE
ncbi:MAG: hypothetical protein IKU36_01505 [Bacteroidales bacterium]|nr:hypothetical protein [Bacteroidales bacterium]